MGRTGYKPTLEEILSAMGGRDMTTREIAAFFRTDATAHINGVMGEARRMHMVEIVWREKYLPAWRAS